MTAHRAAAVLTAAALTAALTGCTDTDDGCPSSAPPPAHEREHTRLQALPDTGLYMPAGRGGSSSRSGGSRSHNNRSRHHGGGVGIDADTGGECSEEED